jgi:hypothetical protein
MQDETEAMANLIRMRSPKKPVVIKFPEDGLNKCLLTPSSADVIGSDTGSKRMSNFMVLT